MVVPIENINRHELEQQVIEGKDISFIKLEINHTDKIKITLNQMSLKRQGPNYYYLTLDFDGGMGTYQIYTKRHDKRSLYYNLKEIKSIIKRGCTIRLDNLYNMCTIDGIE